MLYTFNANVINASPTQAPFVAGIHLGRILTESHLSCIHKVGIRLGTALAWTVKQRLTRSAKDGEMWGGASGDPQHRRASITMCYACLVTVFSTAVNLFGLPNLRIFAPNEGQGDGIGMCATISRPMLWGLSGVPRICPFMELETYWICLDHHS